MNRTPARMIKTAKRFPKASLARMASAMDQGSREDWMNELIQMGEASATLVNMPSLELARRLVISAA